MSDGGGPNSLELSEFLYLSRLGDLIHSAPTLHERSQAMEFAMSIALRHRADGVPWPPIATALRLPEDEIHSWLVAATPKPTTAGQGSPAPRRTLERPSASFPTGVGQQSDLQSISQSANADSSIQSMNQIAADSISHGGLISPSRTIRPPERRQCVLILSGDPRPNGNQFGLEVAAIRTAMRSAGVETCEVACVDLAEISTALAAHRHVIVHLAAHHEYSAVVLSAGGNPLWTTHATLARQFLTPPVRPALFVLNGCASTHLAEHLDEPGIAIIAWSAQLDDEQACCFAQALYTGIGAGTTLDVAFTAASDVTLERWPGLTRPVLHRPLPRPLF